MTVLEERNYSEVALRLRKKGKKKKKEEKKHER